jgi:hypothetical protein
MRLAGAPSFFDREALWIFLYWIGIFTAPSPPPAWSGGLLCRHPRRRTRPETLALMYWWNGDFFRAPSEMVTNYAGFFILATIVCLLLGWWAPLAMRPCWNSLTPPNYFKNLFRLTQKDQTSPCSCVHYCIHSHFCILNSAPGVRHGATTTTTVAAASQAVPQNPRLATAIEKSSSSPKSTAGRMTKSPVKKAHPPPRLANRSGSSPRARQPPRRRPGPGNRHPRCARPCDRAAPLEDIIARAVRGLDARPALATTAAAGDGRHPTPRSAPVDVRLLRMYLRAVTALGKLDERELPAHPRNSRPALAEPHPGSRESLAGTAKSYILTEKLSPNSPRSSRSPSSAA